MITLVGTFKFAVFTGGLVHPLKTIKLPKSYGLVKFITCFWCAEELSEVVLSIYRASYYAGEVPASWKMGNFIPLYKFGNIWVGEENYRPLTLTFVICKSFEFALINHLLNF